MDNILVGEIQLREFPEDMFSRGWNAEEDWELSFPDIQLVVHGLPYSSLIEAFLEATGRHDASDWVESGIFHFWPEQFEDVEIERMSELQDDFKEIDPVQCHYLYYGSGCAYIIALVRRYNLNGCTGLLIESSYPGDDSYWPEPNPDLRFPVPPVFVPLSSWAKAAKTKRPLFPWNHEDSSLELDRLLGEDAVIVLRRYRQKCQQWRWGSPPRTYSLIQLVNDDFTELYQGVDFSSMFGLPNTLPEEWEG